MAKRTPVLPHDRPLPLADPRLTRERLLTIIERCVVTENGCWEWTGSRDRRGYGRVGFGPRKYRSGLVHKMLYEALIGLVPDGRELDHLCRNPSCARPDHLEPVTHRENCLRGDAPALLAQRFQAIAHCPQGHPYDEANTYRRPDGGRDCRTCRISATRRWRSQRGQ